MKRIVPWKVILLLLLPPAAGVLAVGLKHFRAAGAAADVPVDGPVALSGPTMGSTWLVRLRRIPAGQSPERMRAAVQDVLDRIERQMSTYRPDSDLSRFNRSPSTQWFDVPDDLARVVTDARAVSELSGGAFDVTVGPLVNLWGFGPDHSTRPFGTIPPDELITQARTHVGYGLLECRLSPPALRKADPLAYVDLSAIAKGFAAEQLSRRLEALGSDDYLVAVGGETRARGSSPAARPWRVGIENPTPGAHRVLCRVELKNLSLSTSGDYRNFFDSGGRRFCHEIDPATGRPIDNGLASVSVIDPSGSHADAMATALMVLGPDRGYALARQTRLAALFIRRGDGKFETRATPEFQSAILPGDLPAAPDP